MADFFLVYLLSLKFASETKFIYLVGYANTMKLLLSDEAILSGPLLFKDLLFSKWLYIFERATAMDKIFQTTLIIM